MCVCERERECVCVCERERESVCECVCVCVCVSGLTPGEVSQKFTLSWLTSPNCHLPGKALPYRSPRPFALMCCVHR